MAKVAAWIGLAMALAATPAIAELRSAPGEHDARIRTVVYRDHDVIRVDVVDRHITAIEFERGEKVTSILTGDSASFNIVALKSGDVVTIKPLVTGARTNVLIYTNRRRYAFDVRGVSASKLLAHRVVFDFGETAAAQRAPALPTRATMGARGFDDYRAAGTADFRPTEAWDDGASTYLRFSDRARRPAVFRVAPDGSEISTNTVQLAADLVQVQGVAPFHVIRIGEETVILARGDVTPPAPRRVVEFGTGVARSGER